MARLISMGPGLASEVCGRGGCGSAGLSSDLLQALTAAASSAATAMVFNRVFGLCSCSSGSFIALPLHRLEMRHRRGCMQGIAVAGGHHHGNDASFMPVPSCAARCSM